MGMDLNIYTKTLSVDLIPKIQKRFKDFRMDIEFHPEFKFDETTDTGFLSIKLKVHPGHSKRYDKIDFEILTGFELLFSSYNYDDELKNVSKPILKNKFSLSNLFGAKNPLNATSTFVVNSDVDQLLKHCSKIVMLSWQSSNKSELRVSLFFSAILAELTDGVVYDPQSDRYLDAQEALNHFPNEVNEYENSIDEEEFTVDKFEKWI